MSGDATLTAADIKVGDVFRFRYHEKVRKAIEERWYRGHTDHCFDGQLVATASDSGIVLVDTYWGASGNPKTLTIDSALADGTLTFVCNLGDVVDAHEDDLRYYFPTDYHNLSRQHGCYKHWVLRKGAQRNAPVMRALLLKMTAEARIDAERAANSIERYAKQLAELDAGNTAIDIY